MLQTIRERAQGVIAWIIVILVCLTLALWGIHNYTSGGAHNTTVAKVNGETISVGLLQRVYERMRREQQMQQGEKYNPSPDENTELKKHTLQSLIDNQILLQAAKQAGYRISSDQLKSFIYAIPAFQQEGKFSPERFQILLNNMGTSANEFYEDLTADLLVNQVHAVYTTTAFLLPNELSTFIAALKQTRDISFIRIPVNQFIAQMNVSTQQITDYYQQHQQEFKTPEQVKVQYIELSLNDLKKNLTVTNQQLQDFYNNNNSSFSTPASWHIAQILIKVAPNASAEEVIKAQNTITNLYQQIKNGKDFANLAKQYSQDISTAKQGGDIGWITGKTLGTEIYAALQNLTQKNAISEPIRSKYGFIIIKVIDYKKAQTKPLAEVRAEVEQAYREQDTQRIYADKNEKLADLTYANSDTLAVAAKQLNLPIKTTDFFSRTNGKDLLSKNNKFVEAAFSKDVLQQKYNSNVIQIGDDSAIVLRSLDYKPAETQPLSVVHEQIKKLLQQNLAQQHAQQIGETILQAATQGQSFSALAQKNNVVVMTENNLTRDNSKLDKIIINNAFITHSNADNKIAVSGFSLANGDYIVLKVNNIMPGKMNTLSADQLALLKKQLAVGLGESDYAYYTQGLKQKAKITIEQDAFSTQADANVQ